MTLTRQLLPIFRLMVRFVWALIASTKDTLRIIVAHGLGMHTLRSDRLWIDWPPMYPVGIATYAALITLTPGTTVIGIDLERRCFELHVLDTDDPQALIAGLRADFEGDLVLLFGKSNA